MSTPPRCKFALHGPAVEIACEVPLIVEQIQRLFDPFAVNGWPDGFATTSGIVRPYVQAEVLRHLSPQARPLPGMADLLEVYQDGERFWLVDDRWGMAEINLLKSQFRSWILPTPRVDAVRIAEFAIVWPLAQLLRAKGVHLLPAVSVVRDGWAAMVICPFSLESELVTLIRAGYKVIGQRWTALREEDGRLALLHLPGAIERSFVPRMRAASTTTATEPHGAPGPAGRHPDTAWVDLSFEYLGSWQNHAFCDAILVADGGRRNHASIRDVDPDHAAELLRRAWPLVELHPGRRHSVLPQKLAQLARVCEMQLSRNPRDLLDLLQTLRTTPVGRMVGDADRDLAITPWGALRPTVGVAA